MKFSAYNFNDLSLGYKNTMQNKANLKKRNNRNEKKINYNRGFETAVAHMFWKKRIHAKGLSEGYFMTCTDLEKECMILLTIIQVWNIC